MTDRERLEMLVEAGQTMRQAQNAFYGNRSRENLQVARECEQRFDRLVEDFSEGQRSLFDRETRRTGCP